MRDLGFGGLILLIFSLLGTVPIDVRAGDGLKEIRGPIDLSWISPWVGRGLLVGIPS